MYATHIDILRSDGYPSMSPSPTYLLQTHIKKILLANFHGALRNLLETLLARLPYVCAAPPHNGKPGCSFCFFLSRLQA